MSAESTTTPKGENLRIGAWVMYDWANSAYATTIMVVLFPIFYGAHWRAGAADGASAAEFAIANTTAGLIAAFMGPILGAIADRAGARKWLLGFFTTVGVLASAALWIIPQAQWELAIMAFVVSLLGFAGAMPFYDSLLMAVTRRERFDFVSALGYSMGYLGGGLLLTFNVLMTLKPELFGIADKAAAVRLSFLSVAVWWTLFSLPLFLLVPEPQTADRLPVLPAISAGLRQLWHTFSEMRGMRNVLFFLIAYYLYNDGVGTVMRMATTYGAQLKLPSEDMIKAILMVQFIGFPAALAFGKIAGWIGAKRGILICILGYMACCVYGSMVRTATDFYVIAGMIGLVQGGIQSLSRSMFAVLVPEDKASEFFGLYNVVGRFSAIVGPMLMLAATTLTGQERWSILSLVLLFGAGFVMLMQVQSSAEGTPKA